MLGPNQSKVRHQSVSPKIGNVGSLSIHSAPSKVLVSRLICVFDEGTCQLVHFAKTLKPTNLIGNSISIILTYFLPYFYWLIGLYPAQRAPRLMLVYTQRKNGDPPPRLRSCFSTVRYNFNKLGRGSPCQIIFNWSSSF